MAGGRISGSITEVRILLREETREGRNQRLVGPSILGMTRVCGLAPVERTLEQRESALERAAGRFNLGNYITSAPATDDRMTLRHARIRDLQCACAAAADHHVTPPQNHEPWSRRRLIDRQEACRLRAL